MMQSRSWQTAAHGPNLAATCFCIAHEPRMLFTLFNEKYKKKRLCFMENSCSSLSLHANALNIYYLALYIKSLLTPDMERGNCPTVLVGVKMAQPAQKTTCLSNKTNSANSRT